MNTPILYILFFFSIALSIDYSFQTKCSDFGPEIHFPFWVSSQHPQNHCNCHLSFQLSCKANTTIINFPSYGELGVKSISYDIKKLDLFDPENCVHRVFLNLNLSETPFRYYYVVKNYTYLNCSTRLPPSIPEIPCLSGSKHHVYSVESSFSVPFSCRVVKTVAIPISYSPFLADNSFGLGLTWTIPGPHSKVKEELLKILLCVLGMVILVSIKMYNSKKLKKVQIDNESLLKITDEKSTCEYLSVHPEPEKKKKSLQF